MVSLTYMDHDARSRECKKNDIRGFIWKDQPDNSSLLSDVGIFLTETQIPQKLTASIYKAMDLTRSIQLHSNDVYKNRQQFGVKGL